MEGSLGLIAHKLYNTVETLKKTKAGQKKIIPMLEEYYPGRFTNMTPENFLKLHNNSRLEEVYYFDAGCFSKFTPTLIDEWLAKLGVTTQSKILMPESELTDWDELKENLEPSEYEEAFDAAKGKFTEVDKPLMTSYMTLLRLYHRPEYSNKVTSSLYGVDVSPRRDEPIFGKGRYRLTGQKIGEQELTVLLSRNAKEYIQAVRKDTAAEDNQMFLNNLLGLGLTITDSKGYNQGGSNLKGELEKMKTKFRIKNNK